MPLLQYFGWVGSFLLAALLGANWYLPSPIDPQSDVALDQKVHPERVVLDTTGSTPAHDAQSDGETDVAGSETAVPAERQPFEAFAEMARKGLTLPSRLHKLPGRS